jgi:hypothetical protein
MMPVAGSSRLPAIAAGVAGFCMSVALAVLWHGLGLASRTHMAAHVYMAGYAYTTYLDECFSWRFAGVYAGVSALLGWGFARRWSVAAGMVAPLLAAFVIEVVQDPTSHNLFPFEVILYWCPAFVVSFTGALAGKSIREKWYHRPHGPRSGTDGPAS